MGKLAIVGYGEARETYAGAAVQERVFEVDGERGVPGLTAVSRGRKLIEYLAHPRTISFEDGILCVEGVWVHHRDRSTGFRTGILDAVNRFRPADRLSGGDEDPRLLRQWSFESTESGLAVATPALAGANS